jgi:hypothetical protein
MRLLLWNVELGKHAASVNALETLLSERACDVACVTETTIDHFPNRANVLRSTGDYGYENKNEWKQKVTLWSNQPWTEIDYEGDSSLPSGRFLSGVTCGIRFIGVCIPWSAAHVSTGRKNRNAWEDHRTYLLGLKSVIGRYLEQETPICLLGDFNQRIPPIPRNKGVFPLLQEALQGRFKVWTEGKTDCDGKLLIDHIATTDSLQYEFEEFIPMVDHIGQALTDHVGAIGTLSTVSPSRPDAQSS